MKIYNYFQKGGLTMKTNNLKKLLSIATSLSLALAFTFMQSNVASANSPAALKSLEPGQEGSFSSTVCIPDSGFSFSIKEGEQGTYKVTAIEDVSVLPDNQVINKLANFTIVMDDNGMVTDAESIDGVASIELDKHNYDSVFLKVKNGADSVISDFLVSIDNSSSVSCTKTAEASGATHILSSFFALISSFLILF